MLDGSMKILPGKSVQWPDFERKVGVVHQNIDGTELLLGRPDHFVDLILPRHVRLNNHAASARIADFC